MTHNLTNGNTPNTSTNSVAGANTLWLDLGNTRLKYWLINSEKPEHIIASGAELHLQSPIDLLLGLAVTLDKLHAECIYISSVLSQEDNARVATCLATLNCPLYFAEVHEHYLGLSTQYQPALLGIDRWLQLLALAPLHTHYIIVGCGTAITLDVVNNSTHIGGYIVPGLHLQRDALNQNTRKIRITQQLFTHTTLGHTTSDAVHNGILMGAVGLVEKLASLYPNFELILTGGDAQILTKYLHVKHGVLPDLLLTGLQHYFNTPS